MKTNMIFNMILYQRSVLYLSATFFSLFFPPTPFFQPSKSSSSKSNRTKKTKSIVPLARETSRWTAEDDLALITAVHQVCVFEILYEIVTLYLECNLSECILLQFLYFPDLDFIYFLSIPVSLCDANI